MRLHASHLSRCGSNAVIVAESRHEADKTPTRDRLKLIARVVNVDEWAKTGPLSGYVRIIHSMDWSTYVTLRFAPFGHGNLSRKPHAEHCCLYCIHVVRPRCDHRSGQFTYCAGRTP